MLLLAWAAALDRTNSNITTPLDFFTPTLSEDTSKEQSGGFHCV